MQWKITTPNQVAKVSFHEKMSFDQMPEDMRKWSVWVFGRRALWTGRGRKRWEPV